MQHDPSIGDSDECMSTDSIAGGAQEGYSTFQKLSRKKIKSRTRTLTRIRAAEASSLSKENKGLWKMAAQVVMNPLEAIKEPAFNPCEQNTSAYD